MVVSISLKSAPPLRTILKVLSPVSSSCAHNTPVLLVCSFSHSVKRCSHIGAQISWAPCLQSVSQKIPWAAQSDLGLATLLALVT